MMESTDDVNVIVSSLLGIVWLASQKWEDGSFLRNHVHYVVQWLTKSMSRIASLLKEGKDLQVEKLSEKWTR